jgi:hypothetical protein
MPIDPLDMTPKDPFAKANAAGTVKQAANAKQLEPKSIPADAAGPKPAPAGNPFRTRSSSDPRLLLKIQRLNCKQCSGAGNSRDRR